MIKRLLVIVFILLLVVAGMIGFLYVSQNYILMDGHLYPMGRQTLDVRNRELSAGDFSALQQQLPDTKLIWNVPLSDGGFSSDSAEITVSHLTDNDLSMLDYLTELKSINAENCTDYEQLIALKESRPEIALRYNVTIDGRVYPCDAESVRLTAVDEDSVKMLSLLPNLKVLDAEGCTEYAALRRIEQDHPDAEMLYTIQIGNETYPRDLTDLTLESPKAEDIADSIGAFSNLQTVTLVNPDATAEELKAVTKANPNVDISWTVDVFGKTYNNKSAKVDISGIEITNTDDVEYAVRALPKVKKIIMTDCGLSNEEMAAFREKVRDKFKIVWTVYFSKHCKARTDDTMFMPIDQGEYYFNDNCNVMNLQYCEDMVCVDVGHATITNCDWLAGMPHLKYLILAHTGVRDISAISNCKELIYLELDWSTVQDYSPLVECTALEDLNLGNTFRNWKPILKMTWLKNLWWNCRGNYTMNMELAEALPNTRIETAGKLTCSGGWRNLPNYYAMRDYLGKPYMEG